MPVLIPYYLQLGFSMQQIFMLQVVFGTFTLLLEVPSGYLADLWGRKNTLILGAVFYALGYGALFFARDFMAFLGVQILLGTAMSLSSGTDLALLYAWLNHEHKSERTLSAQVIANRQLAQVGAESLAALLGGLLIFWSFQHVLRAQVAVALVPLIIAFCLKEAPYTKMQANHRSNARTVYEHIFVKDPFLRALFLNQTLWSLSTFVAVWTFQKYWQDLSIPLRWFGVLWAVFNLTVGLVGKQVYAWEARWGSHLLLRALAWLAIGGFALMAAILWHVQNHPVSVATSDHTLWVIGGLLAGLCFQVSRGITGVLMREAFNWRLPDDFRATANSLSSMAFRLGFALLGPLMGWLIDTYGLVTALGTMAIFFGITYFYSMRPLIRRIPGHLPPSP